MPFLAAGRTFWSTDWGQLHSENCLVLFIHPTLSATKSQSMIFFLKVSTLALSGVCLPSLSLAISHVSLTFVSPLIGFLYFFLSLAP